jgi:hypothetical protein
MRRRLTIGGGFAALLWLACCAAVLAAAASSQASLAPCEAPVDMLPASMIRLQQSENAPQNYFWVASLCRRTRAGWPGCPAGPPYFVALWSEAPAACVATYDVWLSSQGLPPSSASPTSPVWPRDDAAAGNVTITLGSSTHREQLVLLLRCCGGSGDVPADDGDRDGFVISNPSLVVPAGGEPSRLTVRHAAVCVSPSARRWVCPTASRPANRASDGHSFGAAHVAVLALFALSAAMAAVAVRLRQKTIALWNAAR